MNIMSKNVSGVLLKTLNSREYVVDKIYLYVLICADYLARQ